MATKDMKIKKAVLAYSGGLDTSCEVVAVSGDVGQGTELDGLEEKALKTGASKLYVMDLTKEFVDDYIIPTMKAGADYEGYLLGTSFARPIIARRLVEIAKKAFAPEMQVLAPWRFWELDSRDKEIDYAEAHNIPLKINRETNYSKDKNIWHLSHEGLDLEDPANEPKYDEILEMGVSPEQAPDKPTYVTIHFEQGVPTAVDGEEMESVALLKKLNELGGANGIGLLDLVENRLVGMKSRGVYETPGGAIMYAAHKKLEEITLDKETTHYKALIAQKFGELVYNGQWYTPLRKALSAFVDETQKTVTGDVKLKLYKGNIIPASVTSPYTLHSEAMATFAEDDMYNQADSEGFINLFGLPLKVRALKEQQADVAFPSVE